jgi:diguanylate cyclase
VVLAVTVIIGVCIVAAVAGVLYERQRTLAELAITDPLTRAFNRRHLDLCLLHAIERRRRTGEPASLLLFDIDYFKRINDRWGHAAGDEALRQVAALAGGRARKMDVLFRIGGDEFVLLLPGATRAGALAVAETLRALVAASSVGGGRRLSISVGVSELTADQNAFSWLADADAALYRAKHAGRNRASVSGRAPLSAIGRRALHA